jgi:hypothetical protein
MLAPGIARGVWPADSGHLLSSRYMHLSQPLKMSSLEAGKGGSGHDELCALESFALQKVNEGLDNEIFFVLDGLPRELARHVDDREAWIVGLAIGAER